MKHYPKQKGMFVAPEPDEAPVAFDVVELLDKAGLILQREVKNLTIASASGKLLPAHARDLVSYLKLLHELKNQQEAAAAKLSDEELATAAKE